MYIIYLFRFIVEDNAGTLNSIIMNLQYLLQKKSSKLFSTQQHNSIIYQDNQLLKIGLLNTREFNNNTKLKCLLKYTINNNYFIFGLSKTKIKESS